jgi:phosphoglycerate dehydrogenase-like enzyme
VCRTSRSIEGVEMVATPDRLDQAFDGADFVLVCAPLTKATRHLVGEEALARLPPHAVLVDVSRGGVVDAAALEHALRAGRLAGAALDVFEDEPLAPEHSLWTCPGLLVTPHVAGYTPDFIRNGVEAFLDNIERVRRGEAPEGEVSREREY